MYILLMKNNVKALTRYFVVQLETLAKDFTPYNPTPDDSDESIGKTRSTGTRCAQPKREERAPPRSYEIDKGTPSKGTNLPPVPRTTT
ncbi:unnamed protein product [Haemonchus placei]|uniref:Uncharacterized protein n=1 Tax=Haemonchus placei TaxID=6290 RepID=A0A0N4WS72_HAEPC|nr:unnamed protein product [Haemonchus placei]